MPEASTTTTNVRRLPDPALARKRTEKVREILAKRARIEHVIEQLFEKLPPGDHEA